MENVIISGWAIPRPLYEVVKATARDTGEVQAVGACYAIPPELQPDPSETQEQTWALMMGRSAANSARQREGVGVSYVIGMSADELRDVANHREGIRLGMIMHIAPWGD